MSEALRCITVSGSAVERGDAYGRQAADLIERAVAHYRHDFSVKGVAWDEALRIAHRFWEALCSYDGDLAAEVEGIARGSGQARAAIVLLNARTEVLFWHEQERSGASALAAEECSSAVALGAATRDGKLLHAQNWDWMPAVADHALALRIRGGSHPAALHLVEAGQLARHGLNEAGVAVTAMGLHAAGAYARTGVPSPFIRRKILESGTLAEAVGCLLRSGTSFPHAIMISQATSGGGEALCFETTPDEAFWIEPDADGILVHTNHFKAPAALAKVRDVNLLRCPDSLTRDLRLRRSLKPPPDGRGLSRESFEQAFADDWGRPYGVLRHPAERPGGLTSATVYTLIMAPEAGRAWVALRPYERCAFTELSLHESNR